MLNDILMLLRRKRKYKVSNIYLQNAVCKRCGSKVISLDTPTGFYYGCELTCFNQEEHLGGKYPDWIEFNKEKENE